MQIIENAIKKEAGVEELRLLSTTLLLLFSISVYAAQPIPPDNLSGHALRTWLKQNWYAGKHHDLGYKSARRFMYNFIDKDSGGMSRGSTRDSNNLVETPRSLI